MHSQTKRSSTPFTLVRSTRPGQSALQKAANDSPRIAGLQALQAMANPAAQRMEEDELQMKPIQRMEDEELMQGKLFQRVEEDELQMKPIQRMEEDELQGKFIQRAAEPKTNNTGLPDNLKAGIENLSDISMDGVKVHRNSDKPAAVQAHAYAQGTDIHLAPGQEKHLPHEAWHVVQQAQGRVKPTMQLQGVAVNDDAGLEAEADVMGAKAMAIPADATEPRLKTSRRTTLPLQMRFDITHRKGLKRRVVQAMRLIQSGGPQGNNASAAEVRAHDEAMNPGQHHLFRIVRRSNLVNDLEQRQADHANNNIRDSTLMNRANRAGNAGLVAQLKSSTSTHFLYK